MDPNKNIKIEMEEYEKEFVKEIQEKEELAYRNERTRLNNKRKKRCRCTSYILISALVIVLLV